MAKAMDIALFLSKHGYDQPKNSKLGNMKIQKLLLFSNLIHLAKYDKPLFDDEEILAFQQGCVVEPVRLRYQNQYNDFTEESKRREFQFTEDEKHTLEQTIAIFCKLPASELSALNHQFDFWQVAYGRSLVNGSPQKEHASIRAEDVRQELYKIERVIDAHKTNASLEKEMLNGRTFYYNPNEVVIDEDIRRYLRNFNDGDDDCYTITIDDGRLVIY